MSELVLDSVTVRRGAGPVISDVSLRVAGGEVLALVGPNGAGKTSLIESVSGVTAHSAGTMTLDGEPIDKLSRVTRARRGIVHIEQGRAVFPSLTVRENISLTARTAGELDAALTPFPEPRSASMRRPPCSPGASSRWWCSRAPSPRSRASC